MHQNVIENEFNGKYASLATILPCLAIEFTVQSANDIYFDLNNLHLHVIAKITKTDGTNIDANTASPLNLTLHSIFRENELECNYQNVGDTSQLYPYRSVLESLLNFCKKFPKNSPPKRGMEKRHQRAHECHRSRLEQCRVERLRRNIFEKYPGRAHRSPSFGRLPQRAPYSSKY